MSSSVGPLGFEEVDGAGAGEGVDADADACAVVAEPKRSFVLMYTSKMDVRDAGLMLNLLT